jgi:hypothetical protein
MSNEKWRDIKLGSTVYVYDVEKRNYSKKTVVGMRSDRFTEKDMQPMEIYVEFEILHRQSKIRPDGNSIDIVSSGIGDKHESFYIAFSDKNSRRGTKYVGHLTEEDVLEHKLEVLLPELKKKQSEVDELTSKLKQKL